MTRTPSAYFERLYQDAEDPWAFASSWYEQRKYSLTMSCLPAPRYRSGFEPGCSIGVLTELLAIRCDQLLAVDHVAAAVTATARRLAAFGHVRVERQTVPDQWPAGPFDLLVLSELCYYFGEQELRALISRAVATLEMNATVVAVHWTGQTDYPLTAFRAHALLAATAGFEPVAHHVDEEFLLDVWRYQP